MTPISSFDLAMSVHPCTPPRSPLFIIYAWGSVDQSGHWVFDQKFVQKATFLADTNWLFKFHCVLWLVGFQICMVGLKWPTAFWICIAVICKKLSWTKVASCFLDFHNNDFGKSSRWTKVISEWLVGIFHSRECMLQNRFRTVLWPFLKPNLAGGSFWFLSAQLVNRWRITSQKHLLSYHTDEAELMYWSWVAWYLLFVHVQ